MQDMYLARRAEMADIIAPDADQPPDDPANPGLANLPSISSSSVAEAALSQALQSVAATQEASASTSQAAAQQTGSRRSAEGRISQRQSWDDRSDLTQHPLEMAVPDQASLHTTSLCCMIAL